jgi:hypothetical protein
MKVTPIWGEASCSLVHCYRCFRRTCRLYLQGKGVRHLHLHFYPTSIGNVFEDLPYYKTSHPQRLIFYSHDREKLQIRNTGINARRCSTHKTNCPKMIAVLPAPSIIWVITATIHKPQTQIEYYKTVQCEWSTAVFEEVSQ